MRYETKSSIAENNFRAKTRGYLHLQNEALHSPSASSDNNLIYRKASCACGGGCPQCQTENRGVSISQPSDAAEIEADQIADKVMRSSTSDVPTVANGKTSSNAIDRKCSCDDEEEKIFRKPVSSDRGTPAQSPSHVGNAISSGGRPLDDETRNFFEPRLGHDLGNVRVHTDSTAHLSAKAVDANAYALGSDIVFGQDQYKPQSESGKHLLAHELAHVVQSENSSPIINRQVIFRQPSDGSAGDLAAIDYEIMMLQQIPVMGGPEMTYINMQLGLLMQRRAALLNAGAGAPPPTPSKPKPYLDIPYAYRFSMAWEKAKEKAQESVREDDKKYRGSSITRGLIKINDLAPSPREVWKAGIYSGLFKNDEKELVDESAKQTANKSYSARYKYAKYGHTYGDERYYESSGSRRDDDTEIWSRGREYGLFLADEKAAVLRISLYGISTANILNSQARSVDPKSPAAAKLMDNIHKFTDDAGVVLLGPEMERLFGPYGYTYRDTENRWSVADDINKAYNKSLQNGQILKDISAPVQERWDECMNRKGFAKNNLERAEFDPKCFQSESEFSKEYYNRVAEHQKRFDACGHSGPDDYKCRDRIDSEYYPVRAAQADYQLRVSYQQFQQNSDSVVNSGAFATGGRLAGYVAARLLGRDEATALKWSENTAIIGGLGDTLAPAKMAASRRAGMQNYNGSAGIVVTKDAAITQTYGRPPPIANSNSTPISTPTRSTTATTTSTPKIHIQTPVSPAPFVDPTPQVTKPTPPKPVTTTPVVKPAVVKPPAVKPAVTTPSTTQPVVKPAATAPVVKPAANKPAADPRQTLIQTKLANEKRIAELDAKIRKHQDAKEEYNGKTNKIEVDRKTTDFRQKAANVRRQANNEKRLADTAASERQELRRQNQFIDNTLNPPPPPQIGPGPGKARGGAHGNLEVAGGERNHIPADSATKIPTARGPAVWMEIDDHKQLNSSGQRNFKPVGKYHITSAAEWRAVQKDLIKKGKYMEAIQMDIDDIRSKFGTKYNVGIQEMLEYVKTLRPGEF